MVANFPESSSDLSGMLYMGPSAPLIQDEPIPSQMERQNSEDSMELAKLLVGNSDEVSDKTSRQETVRKE